MNFGARLKVMLSCMEYGVMLYEGSGRSRVTCVTGQTPFFQLQ